MQFCHSLCIIDMILALLYIIVILGIIIIYIEFIFYASDSIKIANRPLCEATHPFYPCKDGHYFEVENMAPQVTIPLTAADAMAVMPSVLLLALVLLP